MTKKNLTDRSRTHSWQGWEHQRKLWTGGPLVKGSEKCRFGSAAVGSALVLLACLLGASWHLRRKATKESRSQGSSKSYVPTERVTKDSEEADAAQPAGFSVLDLGPRVICVVLSVLRTARKPFDALAGRRDRHLTRPEQWPPGAKNTPKDKKDTFLLEVERRKYEHRPNGGSSPVPTEGPRHVAVIMDGNRRFGRVKYRDPLKGHSDGGKKLGEFLKWCMEAGVAMATAFAFSTENWKRDAHEVTMLMDLVCKSCGELMEDAVKNNMRIRVLASDRTKLPERVLTAICKAEHETKDCDGFLFNICLSYGARQEIANACRQIAGEVASGATPLNKVDETTVERHLLTRGLPDPDLLIRTSGEKRVSNFLLFQMAYTELFFVDKLWPDITHVLLRGTM